jgi:tripartite-type tricarboxylate transporter receptor subunit TctC
MRRRAVLLGALAAPALARADTWPERPIRWVVNFPPGGAADTLSRALADQIGGGLGQPIVVENRPGAGGMVGSDLVAKAHGDAHLVIMSNAASHGIGPVLYANVPYDPLADFRHLALVGTFASVLCVNPAVPATTPGELAALARRRGGIEYGSGGNGTLNHLIGQLFARAAGVTMLHVPYRGSAAALTDTTGGQIPAIMESLPIALPHLRAGRLRALCTSEAARAAATPEVPSFAESGYPAVVATNWFGFSTAAGIPDAVAVRWQEAIGSALAAPRLRERFAAIGVVPGTLGPAEYTALVADELKRWKTVIAEAGIRPD